jgi:exopolyphosphatase/pppGpp-phosphohydrolase
VLLPDAAARAEVHGGIEIGAKGIKATVLDIVPRPNDFELTIKLADTTNTTLVAGLARTGHFDPKAVEETAAAVGRYFKRIREQDHVNPDHIYIVGSSGLFSPLEDKPDQVRANQETLREAIRKTTGVAMVFIDAKREAELSIVGIVPRRFRDQAVLIDVGSGNTKGGYVGPQNQFVSISMPYGTVSFTERVKKAGGSFPDQVRKLRNELLAPALKKEISRAAELNDRPRVYLSGGIVWATATFTHPGETLAFTPLSVSDLNEMQNRLTADPGKYPMPDLSGMKDEAKRSRALAEIKRVQKVFSPEQLLAGTQILKALADEMQLEARKRQIYFARYGYLGWILAYVMEKGAGLK